MADENQTIEASNPVIGSLKVTSANLNTLFTILGFVVMVLVAWVLYNHTTDAKDASKELATVMKEMTIAAREQNCLISLPQDRREQNAELCKRIAR